MGSGGRPGAPTGLEATGTSVYTRGAVAQCTPLTCVQVGEGLEGFWLTRESAQSPALLLGQEGHQASSPSSQPLVVFKEGQEGVIPALATRGRPWTSLEGSRVVRACPPQHLYRGHFAEGGPGASCLCPSWAGGVPVGLKYVMHISAPPRVSP